MNADFVESQAASTFSMWRKTFIYLSRPEIGLHKKVNSPVISKIVFLYSCWWALLITLAAYNNGVNYQTRKIYEN